MSPYSKTLRGWRSDEGEVGAAATGHEAPEISQARRIARFELARVAALALMMPYGNFLAAAQRLKYDLSALAARFRVSFEQAANRLTTLQRPGAAAIPFFLSIQCLFGLVLLNRFTQLGRPATVPVLAMAQRRLGWGHLVALSTCATKPHETFRAKNWRRRSDCSCCLASRWASFCMTKAVTRRLNPLLSAHAVDCVF